MVRRVKGSAPAPPRLGHELTARDKCYREMTETITVGRGSRKRERERTHSVREARLAFAWRMATAEFGQPEADSGGASAQDAPGGEDSSAERLERAAAAFRDRDRVEGNNSASVSHHGDYMVEFLHFENFVLSVLGGDHPDHARVLQWTLGDATFDRPFEKTTIEAYFRHLSQPVDIQVLPGVFGRAIGYEGVCMAKKAITHFHKVGCRINGMPPALECYVAHPDVKSILDYLEENHDPEGAPQFEFVAGVRAMRDAIFGAESVFHSHFERLYAWAVILIMLNHMARKSDISGKHVRLNESNPGVGAPARSARARRLHTTRTPPADCCCCCVQCPNACSVLVPDNADEWSMEAKVPLPDWFSFVIHSWKGCKKKYLKPHRVRTDRNRISPMFDPVQSYVDFAACCTLADAIAFEQSRPLGEQRYVALFPSYTCDGGVDPYTPASETLVEKLLAPVFARAFAHMAPHLPTPHSLRVVGLIWYLRCLVSQDRSKLCGRWLGLNLKSWSKYARGGEEAAEPFKRAGKLDPIFSFWCARDSFVGYVQRAAGAGGSVHTCAQT